MDRRKFIKNVGTAAGTAFVLPRFSIASVKSPNSVLNMACVGVGGIGAMTFNGLAPAIKDGEARITATCDIDTGDYAMKNHKKYAPDSKFFVDYREMLEKMGKDIDAVFVSTPDHSHFKISMDAMQAGKHVACQKPLAHDVWQVRELAKAREYYKVQTIMMNQGHATSPIRMLKEWVDSGVCGPIREVYAFCGGPNWKSVYFKKPEQFPVTAEPCPANINWDLWVNQAKYTDYNHIYTPLSWRSFWDYGTGMLGDWFCHTGDAPVWTLDLKDPVSVELVKADCTFDPKVFIPNASIVKWTFAATDKHPELKMYWYDGGLRPETLPACYDGGKDLKEVGMLMIGDKHTISTGVRPNINPRMANDEFFKEFKKNLPKKTIPRVRKDSLYLEFIDAIKGEVKECGSNFGYAAQLTEVALLGSLAQRLGGKIEWDGKQMRSTNRPEAAQYVKETPRKGWEAAVPAKACASCCA